MNLENKEAKCTKEKMKDKTISDQRKLGEFVTSTRAWGQRKMMPGEEPSDRTRSDVGEEPGRETK